MSEYPYIMPDEYPERVQIWLFRTPIGDYLWPPWRIISKFLPAIIQAEDLWSKNAGEHMAVRREMYIIEADLPKVVKRDVSEVIKREAEIYVFTFAPWLSKEELDKVDNWLIKQIGKAYDIPSFVSRGITVLRKWGKLLGLCKETKPVDILGDLAHICYDIAVGTLNASGRFSIDPLEFKPSSLWALAEKGLLTFRGVLLKQGEIQ